jgi:DNA-binding NarL/FixJ family response regulator
MRLMIVDDNEGARELIRLMAAGPDDAICECASAEEAMRTAPLFRPDWVTMDVRMGGVSGLFATRSILAADPNVRIVIVSKYDEPELRRAAAEVGAVGFILKDNLSELRPLLTGRPTRLNHQVPAPGSRLEGN